MVFVNQVRGGIHDILDVDFERHLVQEVNSLFSGQQSLLYCKNYLLAGHAIYVHSSQTRRDGLQEKWYIKQRKVFASLLHTAMPHRRRSTITLA